MTSTLPWIKSLPYSFSGDMWQLQTVALAAIRVFELVGKRCHLSSCINEMRIEAHRHSLMACNVDGIHLVTDEVGHLILSTPTFVVV